MPGRKEFDVHHWLPRSRFLVYRRAPWNLRVVHERRHAAIHSLYGNMTICEMAIALLQEFGPLDQEKLVHDPAYEALKNLIQSKK